VWEKKHEQFFSNFIKGQDVDFLGLQETIKKDYSPAFFRTIDPHGHHLGIGLVLLVEVVEFWVVLGYSDFLSLILLLVNFSSKLL
jgi:hypothetical protein